ncbi:hypothetical protein PV10_06936 [Exophiala mesophila]|uniref:chitinase n=1 Tax=Exophiala mesophila TaxID=212818 RepID=A0A0D1ZS13_EXOME|nr:uncharacterized protein PV10_06936 [Exophiala mesophila]KIV89543.1 hypothetical protein PV10_06936 [Exophiala mesophila]
MRSLLLVAEVLALTSLTNAALGDDSREECDVSTLTFVDWDKAIFVSATSAVNGDARCKDKGLCATVPWIGPPSTPTPTESKGPKEHTDEHGWKGDPLVTVTLTQTEKQNAPHGTDTPTWSDWDQQTSPTPSSATGDWEDWSIDGGWNSPPPGTGTPSASPSNSWNAPGGGPHDGWHSLIPSSSQTSAVPPHPTGWNNPPLNSVTSGDDQYPSGSWKPAPTDSEPNDSRSHGWAGVTSRTSIVGTTVDPTVIEPTSSSTSTSHDVAIPTTSLSSTGMLPTSASTTTVQTIGPTDIETTTTAVSTTEQTIDPTDVETTTTSSTTTAQTIDPTDIDTTTSGVTTSSQPVEPTDIETTTIATTTETTTIVEPTTTIAATTETTTTVQPTTTTTTPETLTTTTPTTTTTTTVQIDPTTTEETTVSTQTTTSTTTTTTTTMTTTSTSTSASATATTPALAIRNVGYYVNWAIYARGFQVQDLQTQHLTHVLYAFANVNPTTGEVYLSDTWADTDRPSAGDDTSAAGTNLFGNLKQLYLRKKQNRNLKTLLSIGGWTFSPNFAVPASTAEGRQAFANSAVNLVQNLGFDGIDIDWEYPSNPAQAADFVLLLRAVREALDASTTRNNQRKFLITVAVSAGPSNYGRLDMAGMDEYLDFWNLMAYDYVVASDTITAHQANLFESLSIPNSTPANTDGAVTAYLANGVAPTKLVLGMPLYGHSYVGSTGLGTPCTVDSQGSWEAGIWDYKVLPRAGASEFYDNEVGAAYSFDADSGNFVTYDTVTSVERKAEYVADRGLGGGMYWETSADKPLGQGSLIETFANAFSGLEYDENELSYPESRYDNLRNQMN